MFTGKPAKRRVRIRKTYLPDQADALAFHYGERDADGTIRLHHADCGAMVEHAERARIVLALIGKRWCPDGSAKTFALAVQRCQYYWASRGVTLSRWEQGDETCSRGPALCFRVDGEQDAVLAFTLHEKDLIRAWEVTELPESSGSNAHAKAFHAPRKPRAGKRKPGKAGGALHTTTFDKYRRESGFPTGPVARQQ